MSVWIRPAGKGRGFTGNAGGWTGYVKVRDPVKQNSPRLQAQKAKFRSAAIACKGKNRSEFLACMSQRA